jgi:multisubunit Na+/H+ antiporter MnhB subunit
MRVGGVVITAIGVCFLPFGFGNNPKRDHSVFHNLADLGAFIQTGLVLVGLGLILLGLSYAIPGELD